MILKFFLYFLSVIGLLFCLTVLPIVLSNLFFQREKIKTKTFYSFSDDLFNGEYSPIDHDINRLALSIRGNVRFAHGKVLSKEDLEEKRQDVYSVELP